MWQCLRRGPKCAVLCWNVLPGSLALVQLLWVGVCVCVRDGERENRSLDNNEEEDIRVDLEFPSLIWETT